MNVTIYHHSKCSKSRETLAILESFDCTVEIITYLENPPTADKLLALCTAMACTPLSMIRTGETQFKMLGLSKKDNRTDSEWLEIMVKNPILIERPIVEIGKNAVMGRPPSNVSDLLTSLVES